MLVHVYVFYQIWFVVDSSYWWMLVPFIFHILYFLTIGRDVSTA
ncbi:hypothetical protein [Aliikangiella coralliicola]|nr:hypothetical protein [Aliikangiella coralliicola]